MPSLVGVRGALSMAFVGLLGACSDSGERAAADAPAREDVILVELREGHSDDRWVYRVDAGNSGAAIKPASAQDESSFDGFRQRCAGLSQTALETLQRSRRVPDAERVKMWLQVVPNGSLSYAFMMGLNEKVEALYDLRTGRELLWTADLGDTLLAPVAWDRSGSLACLRVSSAARDVSHPVVVDVSRGVVVHDLQEEISVEDIAWAPDGARLAILVRHVRPGNGPLERLGAEIGHGVGYSDFKLRIVTLKDGDVREMDLPGDIKYGTGSVCWDTASIASMSRLAQARQFEFDPSGR